ncbi:MAG: hypothetical protein M1814_002406 [Vezdaea aestivalis]|nr:MAG: hypothetical protein M1814_002406 [Vezdaea aestivalis]
MAHERPSSQRSHKGDNNALPLDIFTFIPSASDINIQRLFQEIGPNAVSVSGSPFPGIEQRKLLYFDESLPVYALLRLSSHASDAFRLYLSNLCVNLDVFAVGNRASADRTQETSNEEQAPVREHILSQTAEEGEEPLVVVHEVEGSFDEEGGSAEKIAYAIWKFEVLLRILSPLCSVFNTILTRNIARPKTRLQNPFLAFSISASPKTNQRQTDESSDNAYLPSLVPEGANLLASFTHDPLLGPLKPYLSSSRISHISNGQTISTSTSRRLSARSKPLIPISSAVSSRLRFVSLEPRDGHETLICALDFAISPFANSPVSLDKISLRLSSGTVHALAAPSQLDGLPLICKARDEMSFLYRLTPTRSHLPPNALQEHTLQVDIESTAQTTSVCQPRIFTRWATPVVFESKLEAAQRQPALPGGEPLRSPPPFKPDSIPAMQSPKPQHEPPAPVSFNLVITTSGLETVQLGRVFQWEVFIVNRSARAVKIALVALVKRRRFEGKKLPPRPVSTGGSARVEEIADAVVDENIVFAMQRNAHVEGTEVVCLSTDVRVGPLLPEACHTATMRFVPLAVGVIQVEALRVVDLSTQETVDIRELPVSTCVE